MARLPAYLEVTREMRTEQGYELVVRLRTRHPAFWLFVLRTFGLRNAIILLRRLLRRKGGED